MKTLSQRFWSKVDIKGTDDCWNWTAGLFQRDGYGQFDHKRAHRVAYELHNHINLTSHELICHTCDNRSCCNPAHLYKGTHSTNMADMMRRNPVDSTRVAHRFAKLHEGEIWLIRKLKIPLPGSYKYQRFKFSQGYVAKMFKVEDSTIFRIWHSDKWMSKEGIYV